MATAREVQSLARGLHEKEVINLEASLGSLLDTQGLDIVNPGVEAGWYVLGGEHFVVVCGAVAGDIEAVTNVAAALRGDIASSKKAFGAKN